MPLQRRQQHRDQRLEPLRADPVGRLPYAAKAFEPAGAPQRQGRLERENTRLKVLVGELALDLKKSQEVLG